MQTSRDVSFRLVDVYDESEKITLVMECMEGGELFDRVIDKQRFSEQDHIIHHESEQIRLRLDGSG